MQKTQNPRSHLFWAVPNGFALLLGFVSRKYNLMVMSTYLWTLLQLYHILFMLVANQARYFSIVLCGSYLCCWQCYRAEPCISPWRYSVNKFWSCIQCCVAFASHCARWVSTWKSLIAMQYNWQLFVHVTQAHDFRHITIGYQDHMVPCTLVDSFIFPYVPNSQSSTPHDQHSRAILSHCFGCTHTVNAYQLVWWPFPGPPMTCALTVHHLSWP